jgi:hypothetical protein
MIFHHSNIPIWLLTRIRLIFLYNYRIPHHAQRFYPACLIIWLFLNLTFLLIFNTLCVYLLLPLTLYFFGRHLHLSTIFQLNNPISFFFLFTSINFNNFRLRCLGADYLLLLKFVLNNKSLNGPIGFSSGIGLRAFALPAI